VDFALLDHDGILYVVDYKSGWMVVYPENNTQLGIYAFALLDEVELFGAVKEVCVGIMQPQQDDFIQWDTLSLDKIARMRATIDAAVKDINDPVIEMYPRITEKGCEWCRYQPVCPAQHERVRTMMDNGSPDTISHFGISAILDSASAVKSFLKKCAGYVEDNLDDFPDWKMERGGVNKNEWNDRVDAEAYMMAWGIADPYKPQQLLSVSEAQKVCVPNKKNDKMKTKAAFGATAKAEYCHPVYNSDKLVKASPGDNPAPEAKERINSDMFDE
jgi:hypothetical protein